MAVYTQLERHNQIIRLLLQSKEALTIDEIAKQLHVCNRTIRTDLKNVAGLLQAASLTLESKPGIGVQLKGSDEAKLRIRSSLGQTTVSEQFSGQMRREYIIKRLLLKEQQVTIRDIASELYLSRASVCKELTCVQEWLKRFHLNLSTRPNQGVEITGKEENRRSAMASLLACSRQEDLAPDILPEPGQRIDKRTRQKMRDLIDLDYHTLEQVLTQLESRLGLHFSDEAFASFIIHVAIAIRRLKSHKDITLPESVLSELKQKKEYTEASELARELEVLYAVTIPDSEIGYLLLHILGAKVQNTHLHLGIDFAESAANDIAVTMAKEIIRIAQQALGVSIEGDVHLLNGLILHLRPTVNRLKYGLTLKNPILDQIKENYPDLFGAAWMTSVVFERYLGAKAGEEEIGYIALHLGAALERAHKPLRALVVCTSGIGTSELIAARIERCFREIEIVDVLSTTALKNYPLDSVDVVISTVPVESAKPVVTISPLLTQNDINLLSHCLEKFRAKPKAIAPLPIEEIPAASALTDKNKVIRHICSHLQQAGYLLPGFVQDALQREKTGSTFLGNMTALPHANPAYARKAVLAVCQLQQPIDWSGSPVDLILLLGLPADSSKQAKQFIRSLYRNLCLPEFTEKLRQSENAADIIRGMEDVLC